MLVLELVNRLPQKISVVIADKSYGQPGQKLTIGSGKTEEVLVKLTDSHRWYDVSVKVESFNNFEHRFAGNIEVGEVGSTDPAMAG